MHGCSSASVLIVNAEVDSMGGVIEGGVGSDNKTSPHKAAIERLQAELRQECVARDERRRELEFLEKGGNPLYFKLGFDASVSAQSTSITDQHPDREPKGSFASTASPHGDSVESSGRPGITPWEPNSSNNLMLFDAEHEFSEGGRNLLGRRNVGPSDQSIQMDGDRKTLEHVDSAAFGIPRKAYKRRYRSHPNREGAWSSSTDVYPAHGCRGSSLPSLHGTRDVKGILDAETQNISLNWNAKPASPTNNILPKTTVTNGQDDIELDDSKSFQSTKDKTQGVSIYTASYDSGSENPLVEQLNQPSVSVAADAPKQMGSCGPEAFHIEEMKFAVIECQPSVTGSKFETEPHSYTMNGFGRRMQGDLLNGDHNSNASCGTKVLDSELPGSDINLITDGKNDSEMYTRLRKIGSNGNLKEQSLQDETPLAESKKFSIEKKGTEGIDSSSLVGKESASAGQSQQDNDVSLQSKKELNKMESALENKVNYKIITEGTEAIGPTQLESGRKPAYPEVNNSGIQNETSSFLRHHDSVDVTISDHPEGGISTTVSTVPVEVQTSSASKPKLESKIDEDTILKEALIIEAKRRRIAELSLVTSPVEICRKAHWDNVLEEMAWMANDFAQERIWKVAAASQISYHVAVTCLRRKNEKKSGIDVKRVAHTLAKDVMEFWHSMESQQTSKELEQQCQKNGTLPIRAYAVRILKCNKLNISHNQAVMPLTPNRISDSGVSNLIWEDCLAEEKLFYTIPPGAMETYRTAIESHVAQFEITGSTVQEEVVASARESAADLESQDNAYDEDEGETNTYNMPVAFEGSLSSRYGQKKQKHCGRSYDMGSYLLPMRFAENKLVTPQAALLAKRPGSNLNVSIPTKRVRTASRRVISPFGAGASGFIHVPNKTDASSCDTSLFQDDQSTIRGGLLVPNCLEVESTGEFEKQFPFDTAEVSTRPKKKKKAKHLNATYEERWQVDSSFQIEQFQRDHLQKRTDSYQLESNGNSGLLGQPIAKKPKLMRQEDNSFDNIPPSGRSVPSPVGSQISNMSNPKFIKMLGGRDRGRKTRALQMSSGQPGSGVPWSLFEDQALVVLAHDLGPNWELVSDAFNSAMQFNCIFRDNRECKERHIFLMDRTSGDGGDSAEDSGSSYPSTLPGIPKGSARQLFQRLQGPMEEETLKSHFEKIIMIGKKQHYRKTQDSKQFQQPHSSHTIALSQSSPNNLNGGPILTPLDLCDTSISGPDVPPPGYQGAHSSGLAIPNQGPITQMLPPSSASSALTGSSNLIGNSFSSSPGSLSSSARSGSLPADEHQRMHLYNKMIPGRNIPQPNISAPGALPGTDRGVHMLPSGNGIGIMPGVNRSMSMAWPGFQGLPSSSMVNSGSAAPPGMSSPNMHAGVASVQGSSIARPPMMRPGSNQDPQRQTLVSDHQIPAKSQGTSHFGGLSSPFPNQTALPPVAPCSLHHQPSHSMSPQQPQVLSPHHHQPHFQGQANHASNPQQQSYAMRLAKERQLHQRFLQQQQYAASNPLMPHAQSQPQLPISSPVQNSSQVQPQTSSPVSLPSLLSTSVNTMPQQQQKHQIPTQGVGQNAQTSDSGLANQMGKQRQRQQNQFSHANRQHPLQRQAQQQGKVVKGVGSGKSMMLQNVPVDVSPSGGVSTNQVNQSLQKGEPPTNSVQSHGPLQNSVQPTRPFMASQSNQILPQQKIYSGQASSSSKHLQQTSESDNNSQCTSHQKLVNQNQTAPQRPNQPDRLNNSGPSIKQQGRDSDADQHPASSSAEMYATTTLQQAPNNASNAAQVVSRPSVHKWHGSEPLSDTNALKSPKILRSLVSMPSNSSESVPQTGKGLCPRPTTSLPLIQSDVSAQWQQQKRSQVPQSQQPLPPLHSQQQGQLLQAGSGNSYGRSSDSRLE